MISFSKMNGAGNDFVVLDNRDESLSLSREQIARLCNRQRGIGADGLLAVEPSQNGADYRMRYYNADGGEAEMCGNGARCFARFVNRLTGGKLHKVSFETIAGVIRAEFDGDLVTITLSPPFGMAMGAALNVDGEPMTVHSVNTGVPHAVVVVDGDLEKVDIRRFGSAIRFHEHFAPSGTNVNFMKVLEPGPVAIRTYERGVEDETLACGTGMVACALIHAKLADIHPPIRVQVRGGDTLEVNFMDLGDNAYDNVTLKGPADFTFDGSVAIG